MNVPISSGPRRFVGHHAIIARLAFCIVLASPFRLMAEDAPPEPPLVGTAPDPSAWIITVQQKKALQPPVDPKAAAIYLRALQSSSRIIRVEIEKSGKNRREDTYWENKKKEHPLCTRWLGHLPADELSPGSGDSATNQ